ncbi:hypothetical protein CEK29_19970 [Bordetella genomosp. 5]|uniref:Carbamoyl phosphate synthase ATP-binding domain-containing protein n=1 Tax=Bordetella genomosp. 5 TaxID=1395608 RepID=A0A261T5K0_9BORD|nr:hypothetical protein [Bordetella genomosp. 5]OZI38783.1 hypothetical protein CEK29_19970 [Bordetella genomosp. 5]OZI44380.1 hypothetical protein CAL25_22395 [Bordetella genomosp. 5]
MGANVSLVDIAHGASRRRRPPGGSNGQSAPAPGLERRLDIQVYSDARVTQAGRPWERSVWREARVLIAECPAPRLAYGIEQALRAAACGIARDRGWRGLGTVAFSLDDATGMFRVLEAALQHDTDEGAGVLEPISAHTLDVRIGACVASGRPDAHLVVCGTTRGDALRRAYQAIGDMPGLAVPERAFLLNRIASPAFCSGLTGSRLDRITDWSDHRAAS